MDEKARFWFFAVLNSRKPNIATKGHMEEKTPYALFVYPKSEKKKGWNNMTIYQQELMRKLCLFIRLPRRLQHGFVLL